MAWTTISRYTNGQNILHTDMNALGNNLKALLAGTFSTTGGFFDNSGSPPINQTTTSQIPVSFAEIALPNTVNGSAFVIATVAASISSGNLSIGFTVLPTIGGVVDYTQLPYSYDVLFARTSRTPVMLCKVIPIVNTGSSGASLVGYWFTSGGGTATLYDANVAAATLKGVNMTGGGF